MELLSQRAYARRRGVSQAAVWKAIRDGRISTVAGKINPKTADREWAENTDRSKPRNSISGDPKRRRRKGEPSAPMDLDAAGEETGVTVGNGNGAAASGYAEARAKREACLAEKARLDLELQMGTLVRTDEVRRAAFNAARKARDQLIALPQRVAAILAATEDPAEVLSILEEEIEKICLDLSGTEWQ